MHRLICAVALSAGIWVSAPAFAQFGSIFGDPPRPPQAVPGRPPGAQPRNPTWDQRSPGDRDSLPPPQSAAPAPGRPAMQGGIQSQPLPPPPGATPQQSGLPPAPPPGRSPQPDQALQTPGQLPLSGLPPGQRQPRGMPGQQGVPPAPAPTTPQPGDEVVVALPAQKMANPTAVFSGLDKITGRIITFDVAINETVQFGALQVTPRVCYTRPPTETPNTDSFLEVDEITLQGEVRRIFTGWMFASSPGLHAVEHPIYDVWLVDCKNDKSAVAGAQQPVAPTSGAATPSNAAPRR